MEPDTASPVSDVAGAGAAGSEEVSLLEEVYLAASLAAYIILQSVFRSPLAMISLGAE